MLVFMFLTKSFQAEHLRSKVRLLLDHWHQFLRSPIVEVMAKRLHIRGTVFKVSQDLPAKFPLAVRSFDPHSWLFLNRC